MSLKGQTPIHFINPGFMNRKLEENREVPFETALSKIGFGRFHYSLVIVCGLVYLAAGYQNGLTAYVIPAAQCDLNMSSEDKGLLNAMFLIGGLASAFFWGILADQIGRRKVLVYAVLIDAVLTAVSSCSQTFVQFLMFRFVNGFVIGAPSSIVCTYLGEFIGVRERARCLVCMGFFFTLSWLLLPLISMVILPLEWRFETKYFIFNSWRLFVLTAALPTLVSGLLLACFFPESPKFLYSRGDETEAIQVMRDMYEMNNGSGSYYPVESIQAESAEGARSRRSVIRNSKQGSSSRTGKSLAVVLAGVLVQVRDIFTPPVLSATLLSSALMFCNMFAYYGFGLWLPELFDRFNTHYRTSNESVTVCELTRMKIDALNSTATAGNSSDVLSVCQRLNTEPAVYVNTFIIGLVCLALNVICAAAANKMGLKFLSVVSTLICGACAIGIYFVNTSLENLIMSCLFLGFVGAANSAISSAICDLFPTRTRGLAVCCAMFAGRLGAVLSNLTLGYLLDTLCELPIFLMAATLIVGSLLALFLPGKYRSKCVPAP